MRIAEMLTDAEWVTIQNLLKGRAGPGFRFSAMFGRHLGDVLFILFPWV